MRQMGIDEAAPIRRLYIVVGRSRVLAMRFIEKLRARIRRADGAEPIVERAKPEEGDLQGCLARLATAPLFGGRPVLVVEGAHPSLLRQRWVSETRWGRGVLIIWVEKLPTSDRKRLMEQGCEIVSAEPPERVGDLVMRVKQEAAALKLRLTQSEVEELLRRVDNDFDAAIAELEKLSSGGGRMRELVADHAPSKSFDLTGAVEEWDPKRALLVLKRSFEEGIKVKEGHRITIPQEVVVHLMQQVLWGLSALEKALGGEEFPDWRMRRLKVGLRRLGRHGEARIRRALRLLHEADGAIKTGADPYLTLEGFVLQALV